MTNTQIVIAELPSDSLTPAHFKQTTADMPVAGDGQVLLKVILMSI
ncbi:MAG TPA: NADP-dependent oxidoreductase, partial [Sulfitobacter sp.]|nr:NADP-dependent oxidoreductase [Sulfitobacter sp.]